MILHYIQNIKALGLVMFWDDFLIFCEKPLYKTDEPPNEAHNDPRDMILTNQYPARGSAF